MLKNYLNQRMKLLLIQISLLALIGLIAWFGIRPILSTIQVKKDDVQKLSVTREYRESQLQRLPDLESQHALIKERESDLDIILTKDRLVEFIEALEQLAADEQVAIEIESRDNAFLESKMTIAAKKEPAKPVAVADADEPAAEPAKKGPAASKETGLIGEFPLKKFLKLTLTVSGEYISLARYLHQLETLPYALDVVSLDIKSQPEDGDTPLPDAGVLNPFGIPVTPSEGSENHVLDAVFEMIVYMQD